MDDDKEPFCGIGAVPEGKRRATPKECIDKGQVRYYGVVGIDPKLFKVPNVKKLKDEILLLNISVRALGKRFKNEKESFQNARRKAKDNDEKDPIVLKHIVKRKADLLKLKKRHDKDLTRLREAKIELKQAETDLLQTSGKPNFKPVVEKVVEKVIDEVKVQPKDKRTAKELRKVAEEVIKKVVTTGKTTKATTTKAPTAKAIKSTVKAGKATELKNIMTKAQKEKVDKPINKKKVKSLSNKTDKDFEKEIKGLAKGIHLFFVIEVIKKARNDYEASAIVYEEGTRQNLTQETYKKKPSDKKLKDDFVEYIENWVEDRDFEEGRGKDEDESDEEDEDGNIIFKDELEEYEISDMWIRRIDKTKTK